MRTSSWQNRTDTTAGAPHHAVRLTGVSKNFGDLLAVDALDLDIPTGICLGLLGPNGAGKSTLMRLLTGTVTPTSGTVDVLGMRLPDNARGVRARTGLVPQLDTLDEELTCAENLEVYARLYGLGKRERSDAVARGLALARLQDRAEVFVENLSGGMRRRLLIARGLLHRPELVLLDEPTVGLDPQVRQALWSQIDQIRVTGTTVVLTTHYIEEAERLCEVVAIVDHGRLLALDTPARLIDEYVRTPVVVEVMGDDSRLGRVATAANQAGVRHRPAGTSLILFAAEVDRLATHKVLRTDDLDHRLRRPANLEDVFVALTGEALR